MAADDAAAIAFGPLVAVGVVVVLLIAAAAFFLLRSKNKGNTVLLVGPMDSGKTALFHQVRSLKLRRFRL